MKIADIFFSWYVYQVYSELVSCAMEQQNTQFNHRYNTITYSSYYYKANPNAKFNPFQS